MSSSSASQATTDAGGSAARAREARRRSDWSRERATKSRRVMRTPPAAGARLAPRHNEARPVARANMSPTSNALDYRHLAGTSQPAGDSPSAQGVKADANGQIGCVPRGTRVARDVQRARVIWLAPRDPESI